MLQKSNPQLSATEPKSLRCVAPPYRGATRNSSRNNTDALMASAMRACDHWGDSPASRDDMRRQIAEVPPHLRAELLAHFRTHYPEPEANPWQ